MTNAKARQIIRDRATEMNCLYRITAGDEVHFFGTMPNTNQVGWFLFGQGMFSTAENILSGRA